MDILEDVLYDKTIFEDRMIHAYVPGKEMTMAHIISGPEAVIYEKLSLEPDWDNLSKWAIGIMKFTPWEASFIAADVATDTSAVEIGFVDRFVGCLVITGLHTNVAVAMEGIRNYFRDSLSFTVCKITKS